MIDPTQQPNPVPTRTSEWVLVTPEMAARWETAHRFPRQRQIDASHVDMLMGAIQHGEFEPCTIEFYHTPYGIFLTDGQHRLAAIARAGRAVPLNVVRKQGTLAQADQAYARTDRGRSRTYAQCAAAVALPETLGLPSRYMAKLLQATVPLLAGFEHPQRHPAARSFDARVAVAVDWKAEAAELLELYAGPDRGWAARLEASVPMAVALVTLRYAPLLAREFWGAVRTQEYLKRGEPEHTLVRWLEDHRLTSGESQPRYARSIALAWNARGEGRSLSYIKPTAAMADRPILLRGTPYDGKRVVLPRGE